MRIHPMTGIYRIASITLDELNNPRSAIRLYRTMIEQYPGSRLANQAQFKVAELYFNMAEYRSALSELEQYLDLFPGAERHNDAEIVANFLRFVPLRAMK